MNAESETDQLKEKKLLKGGIIGSSIAAVCCFTPLLVIAFTGAGLAGLIGGLDYVLFPLLFGSLGIVALALYMQAGRPGPSPKSIIGVLVVIFSGLLIWLEFRYALRISLAALALVLGYWYYLRSAQKKVAS